MSRAQAKPATRKELAYLAYWRGRGYTIAIDEPIPLNTVTPPGSFIVRHPIRDALGGAVVLAAAALVLGGAWLARGAGL